MKLTLVVFNITVMIAVIVQYCMHTGEFTTKGAFAAIGIGFLIGAVVAGIAYVTVGKNAE